MSRELGVRTLGEGVEREEEFLWLRERGVDLFQGFFFAKPASPPEQPQVVLTSDKHHSTSQLVPAGLDIDLSFSLDDRSLQGVLDSLNEQVAVLERSGKIVMVNRAWRQVGGLEAQNTRFTGVNYLDVCRLAVDTGDQDALRSYEGIRGVLSGQASEIQP